jgi:zinc transporter
VRDLEAQLLQGVGFTQPEGFVRELSLALLNNLKPAIRTLGEAIDTLEQAVIDGLEPAARGELAHLRKQAITFKRYLQPQLDALDELKRCSLPWLSAEVQTQLNEDRDDVQGALETLELLRERAQVIQDEVERMTSERLNRTLYLLTVLTTIFLPLGFLTGLLGVNLGGIPGAENPDAFWVFIAVLVLLTLVQVWAFKALKWF